MSEDKTIEQTLIDAWSELPEYKSPVIDGRRWTPNGEPCRGCGTYAGFTQPDDIFEDGEHKGKPVVCLYPIMECVQCKHREWCD